VQMSEEVEGAPGRIACITFAEPPMLAVFERGLELSFPLFADPSRQIYAAFGLGRGSIARVWLHPKVWARYARLLAAGRRPAGDGADTLQLGGNAVLDASGRVRWIYRGAGPDDRPAPATVIAELRRAADTRAAGDA
jgi:hypothetical protein